MTPSLPQHRWGIGFMAKRWWLLLIALPFLALIAGGCFEWVRYQRGNQARCIVQVSMSGAPPVAPALGSTSSPLAEAQEIILSDEVLEQACTGSSFFPGATPDALAKLRELVHCEPIRGTSLLIVSVDGLTPRTVGLCNAVTDAATRKVKDLQDQARMAVVTRKQDEVEVLQETMIEKRKQFLPLVIIAKPGITPDSKPGPDFLAAKQEFEEAAKAYETAKQELIPMMAAYFGGPENELIIHERAAMPKSTSPMVFLKPVAYSSLWMGAAIMLAVILAYLLEALFPKRIQPCA